MDEAERECVERTLGIAEEKPTSLPAVEALALAESVYGGW